MSELKCKPFPPLNMTSYYWCRKKTEEVWFLVELKGTEDEPIAVQINGEFKEYDFEATDEYDWIELTTPAVPTDCPILNKARKARRRQAKEDAAWDRYVERKAKEQEKMAQVEAERKAQERKEQRKLSAEQKKKYKEAQESAERDYWESIKPPEGTAAYKIWEQQKNGTFPTGGRTTSY